MWALRMWSSKLAKLTSLPISSILPKLNLLGLSCSLMSPLVQVSIPFEASMHVRR